MGQVAFSRGQLPQRHKKIMNGLSVSNSELAKFFRSHLKASKLTKEEFNYIDGLIFSHTSPKKKSLLLFPRATPLQAGRETPLFNSRTSSLSSTALRTSRKRLEIFDKEFETSKTSFALHEEPTINPETHKRQNDELMEIFKETPDKIPKLENIIEINNFNSTETLNNSSTPRQMTDAAKELMASINMNFDSNLEKFEEVISKTTHQTYATNLPKFLFEIPAKKLPEFHFDISEDKHEKIVNDRPEYKFDFEMSEFEENKQLEPSLESKLPNYYFKID